MAHVTNVVVTFRAGNDPPPRLPTLAEILMPTYLHFEQQMIRVRAVVDEDPNLEQAVASLGEDVSQR